MIPPILNTYGSNSELITTFIEYANPRRVYDHITFIWISFTELLDSFTEIIPA